MLRPLEFVPDMLEKSTHPTNEVMVYGKKTRMLWKIFLIVMALWLVGFGFQIGGNFIHFLLVAAFVVVIWHFIVVRRRFA